MGYAHIDNLYKNQEILLFKWCYALEKIHGTSAHLSWRDGTLGFFAGGASHDQFVALFDADFLATQFDGIACCTIYGEAYGGKMQGMSATYGPDLRFVAFDVKIGQDFLDTPRAEQFVVARGLEFVHWVKVPTDLDILDAERDSHSVQAVRNGCGYGKPREGVVLRPPIEVRKNNRERICAKHKSAAFSETKSPRKVIDPAKQAVLSAAEAVAEEWVTPMRLAHVLDKLPGAGMEQMGQIIAAMTDDIRREGAGEIVWSKEVERAIGKTTALTMKRNLALALQGV